MKEEEKSSKIQKQDKNYYNNDMAQLLTTSTSTFEFFKEYGYLYVDKTDFIYRMIMTNRFVFLSRPRRFGKSLTLSTLEAIFQGRRELFDGLYISKTNYDWKKYPVIRISIGSCSAKTGKELNKYLNNEINIISERLGAKLELEDDSARNFRNLIEEISKQEKAVILIDEYEKVITDNIYSPHIEELRDTLSQFYQVLKDQDSNIRFVFITGVTKYTKLSIFSKMNNLRDISLDREYADMLGYTQEELESYFAEHIDEAIEENSFDRTSYLKRIKEMYDGYKFHPKAESVYNPVSVNLFFSCGGEEFDNYWMDTGGNTLVYELSKKVDFNMVADLSEPISKTSFSTFDIIRIAKNTINVDFLKSLLYQTGYLTISRADEDGGGFYLDFPNREVRETFNLCYLAYATGDDDTYFGSYSTIRNAMATGKIEKIIKGMRAMFAGLPAIVSSKAEKSNEYYYESMIYMILSSSGIRTNIEEITSQGRIDAVAENKGHIYIMEFKKDKSAKEAMEQIKSKGYADKYLNTGKRIHLLGINFSTKERNIDDFIVEDL